MLKMAITNREMRLHYHNIQHQHADRAAQNSYNKITNSWEVMCLSKYCDQSTLMRTHHNIQIFRFYQLVQQWTTKKKLISYMRL
jgi:hypothetical protein